MKDLHKLLKWCAQMWDVLLFLACVSDDSQQNLALSSREEGGIPLENFGIPCILWGNLKY